MQMRALDILQFKLNVLWVIADSIMLASTEIKIEGRDYFRQPVLILINNKTIMENKIEHSDIYALAFHHRFQWEEAQQSYVILFPEGMVKLHGGAGEVIKRVDGKAYGGRYCGRFKSNFS